MGAVFASVGRLKATVEVVCRDVFMQRIEKIPFLNDHGDKLHSSFHRPLLVNHRLEARGKFVDT